MYPVIKRTCSEKCVVDDHKCIYIKTIMIYQSI